jgi:hypothetical protein
VRQRSARRYRKPDGCQSNASCLQGQTSGERSYSATPPNA